MHEVDGKELVKDIFIHFRGRQPSITDQLVVEVALTSAFRDGYWILRPYPPPARWFDPALFLAWRVHIYVAVCEANFGSSSPLSILVGVR
jgi:hypothetical protein